MREIIFLLLLLTVSHIGYSHEMGTIKGKITDKQSGEPIIGANIIIGKTMLGTCSDINGDFEFRNIHAGNYVITVSYIGYETREENAAVVSDKITNLVISLEPSAVEIDGFAVVAGCPYSTASLKHIRNIDLEIRPHKSSQDLLKLVPGLITAQHAGGGKAEQIFLRGFDADHGTDVNISVDGIPVNMVSHGHGQGYADLHFLIPELVDELDVYKGPYFAQFGNLATAGAVQFKTKDILKDNMVKIEGGQFNTFRGTLLYQLGKGSAEQNGYIATQYYTTNGPFESPMALQRMNVYGKYFVNLGHNSKLTFSLGSFSSVWDASGQIPQRTVDQGIISRFGAIDDMEGGQTSRSNFSIKYEQKDDKNNRLSIQAYLCDYDFKLFSNFTYFLNDSINGDMIEQLDKRFMHGLNAAYNTVKKTGKTVLKSDFGVGYRADNIELALWHSPDRIRNEVYSDASVKERNLFTWFGEEFVFSPKFRIQAALRADYFTFNVDDHIERIPDTLASNLPHASGYSQQAILSPKLNMVYSPISNLDLYFNSGSGFHSNDARNVIFGQKIAELEKAWRKEGLTETEIIENLESNNFNTDQRDAITLPRAIGSEIGLRTQVLKNLNIGFAGWYLYLEKEFVYVGDGGYSELSDPTQRIGIDFEARFKINSWLWADVDLCLSNGKLIGPPSGENDIPLAPRITSTGGLSVLNLAGFNGMIRYTYIGDRPANESNTVIALGYTIINIGLAYEWKPLTFSVTVENLFNTEWNEAQFDTESRMSWESEPVSEIHFTPGNPLNFQFGISYLF